MKNFGKSIEILLEKYVYVKKKFKIIRKSIFLCAPLPKSNQTS